MGRLYHVTKVHMIVKVIITNALRVALSGGLRWVTFIFLAPAMGPETNKWRILRDENY